MAEAATTTAATTTAATTTTTAAPWHQGVDAGIIEKWTNKGYDLSNPKEAMSKLWEQYANLESHMGVPADRIVRLPKDANDTAGWQGVYQKFGVPKEAKDYDFAGVKFADGTDVEEGFTTAMRAALHGANVSKDKAPEIVKAVIKYLDDANAAESATTAATLTEQKARLLKDWGQNAEMNLLTAKQAVKRLGIDQQVVDTLENAIGYDKVMEMFRKIGAGTSEDSFVESGRTASPTTAANARARLTELQSDQAWTKRLMSGDVAARREFEALTEQIAGVVAAAA